MTDYRTQLLHKLDDLQIALVASATNDAGDTSLYEPRREELLRHPELGPYLPSYLRRYRKLKDFWPFIQNKFSTYQERRNFIHDSFASAVAFVEDLPASASNGRVTVALTSLSEDHVRSTWTKALARLRTDPEGAITSARTLLESVCKLILDEESIVYAEDAKLPQLYSTLAKNLNLAPAQHLEQVFRQILGGCQSVVEGLGAVRNRVGDAHGHGKRKIRAAPRHAELAVNLAGAMTLFLVDTWQAKGRPPAKEEVGI